MIHYKQESSTASCGGVHIYLRTPYFLPEWRNGSRVRLKIESRKGWRFKSSLGHKKERIFPFFCFSIFHLQTNNILDLYDLITLKTFLLNTLVF